MKERDGLEKKKTNRILSPRRSNWLFRPTLSTLTHLPYTLASRKRETWLTYQRCRKIFFFSVSTLSILASVDFVLITKDGSDVSGGGERTCWRILGPKSGSELNCYTPFYIRNLFELWSFLGGRRTNKKPDTRRNWIWSGILLQQLLGYRRLGHYFVIICDANGNVTSDEVKSMLVRTGRWWVGWMGR